jgi:hypothetical protein
LFRLSCTGGVVLYEPVNSTCGTVFFMVSVPACETVLRIIARDVVAAVQARA